MNHLPQPATSPATVTRSGPLTWVQQWHWFERTIPSPRRVNPTPLADHCHIPPPATVADVHAALASLTARHEALRTTVDPLRPIQHVHRADWAPLPVDYIDVPAADAGTLEAATAELAARPIDPERNPPWRARVLLEAGKPRAVLVAAHHVLIDGWGLAVLINQLHDQLRGDHAPAEASTHPLDTVATQPPQRARAAEREWLIRLASNPTGVLAPFGGTDNGEGRHRLQHRSVGAYDDLDRVARRYRVSPEVVVLAALAHDVATRTGEHRFLASVVVSNRARAALRNSIGVQALTVPVQIDLCPGAAFGEVVASVAAASAAAYRHGQWRPAELVAAQARMDRRRGVVTVPTIEYNCYSWPRDYLVPAYSTPPDGPATWIHSAPDEPCDTLYVDLSLDEGVVTLDVTVGDHLLDAEQAAVLPVRLCGLLRALADGAERPVPERSLTPAAPGWWRAPQGWVRLAAVEDVLRGHLGVHEVTVAPSEEALGEGDEPHLVAHVRIAPDVTPDDLHRHVLDHLGEVPGLVAPGRYVLSPASLETGRTSDQLCTGSGTGSAGTLRIPLRPPATDAERALAAAVAAAGPGGLPTGTIDSPDAVDMNRSLADHGVTLVAVPRLLALLHRSGFTGIASDELAGTASLGHLAAALEPLPPRAHRGGETSP
ncbi:condensation domain-containing protein [Streptomyces olivoreticuli]|uniref:condensation domain-containing protein n=1 Tax=Streptomyces olivoreticuli TaxID=68246 RepID=UPI00265A9C4F|nr:condensation domain-containing protein [Streptomyces olivoreticuli]WKK23996.1 condensation domain-containing protein [Streptomyces olivoreticuli]